MTILDALKKLYVKLGGTIDEKHSYDDIGRLMEDVADVINNSPGIPEVTSEDDGKVLKVVDGAWNKAEADDVFYDIEYDNTNFTHNGESIDGLDIFNAYNQRKQIRFNRPNYINNEFTGVFSIVRVGISGNNMFLFLPKIIYKDNYNDNSRVRIFNWYLATQTYEGATIRLIENDINIPITS